MAFSAVTERGSATEAVSDTSLAVSPSANLTVGKIVFVLASTDNTATVDGASTDHTSITDTHGHTWTKVFEQTNTQAGGAADGVTGSLWFTKITTQIGTGDSITLTIGTARTVKVLMVWEVTVGAGNTIQLATSGSAFLLSTSANPGAVTLSGLASKEYLFLGSSSNESNQVTWTEDADYTNVFAAEGVGTTGGAATSNITAQVGYRIATLTGDTFDIDGLVATEHVIALLAFEEIAVAGAFVADRATSSEASPVTTHTVTLPTDIVAGDYILIAAAIIAVTGVTGPSGYTEIVNTSDIGLGEYRIWYKVGDGSEVTTTFTTGAAAVSAHLSWSVRNASVPEVAGANGTSAAPDPPSLSPASGSATYLWLAIEAFGGAVTQTAGPASYVQVRTVSLAGVGGIGGAENTTTAASENPGAFTLSGSGVWRASTLDFPVFVAAAAELFPYVGGGYYPS